MEEKRNRVTFYLKLILLIICFIPLSIVLFLMDLIIKLFGRIFKKKEEEGE